MIDRVMRYFFKYNKVIFGYTFYTHPFIYWIGGFVKLFEGICNILTFGCVLFDFHVKYVEWIINSRCKHYD